MFFSFAIVSLGKSNHSKYILEIINFKQLVHAINIGWAHKNKFKLHKNVSLIKFSKKKKNLSISKKGAIKLRPLSFSRTLLARSLFWLTEMSMRQRNNSVFPKNLRFLFHVLSFVKKIKIFIHFKEVYSIKQIITVSTLQTGQPASAGDPTYHVNEFIQQPITRSEQFPHLAYVTAFLRTGLFLDTF